MTVRTNLFVIPLTTAMDRRLRLLSAAAIVVATLLSSPLPKQFTGVSPRCLLTLTCPLDLNVKSLRASVPVERLINMTCFVTEMTTTLSET